MPRCDGCTICCSVLEVRELEKPAGKHCSHCIVGVGCSIYKELPGFCKDFHCMYNQIKKASINVRPDKCGVIFEKITDDIIIGSFNPMMKRPNVEALAQIKSFNGEGFSVVLFDFSVGKSGVFLNPGANREYVLNTIKEKARIVNGRRNLQH